MSELASNELDSYFIKKYFRQDLLDFQDIFFLPHFPEENEETQSPSAKKDNFM